MPFAESTATMKTTHTHTHSIRYFRRNQQKAKLEKLNSLCHFMQDCFRLYCLHKKTGKCGYDCDYKLHDCITHIVFGLQRLKPDKRTHTQNSSIWKWEKKERKKHNKIEVLFKWCVDSRDWHFALYVNAFVVDKMFDETNFAMRRAIELHNNLYFFFCFRRHDWMARPHMYAADFIRRMHLSLTRFVLTKLFESWAIVAMLLCAPSKLHIKHRVWTFQQPLNDERAHSLCLYIAACRRCIYVYFMYEQINFASKERREEK